MIRFGLVEIFFGMGLYFVAILGIIQTSAQAENVWGTYHWPRESNPLTLELINNMTPDWESYLLAVSDDWSSSSVINSPVIAGSTVKRDRKKCSAVKGKIKVCNAAYGFNGWLGLAQIWVNGSHIEKATSKVNDSYFSTSTYNNPYAKQHVLCQEVGHDFGLGHRAAVSCMDDRNGLFDPLAVDPSLHDYETLESIYNSHGDEVTSDPDPGPGGCRGRKKNCANRNVTFKRLGRDRYLVTIKTLAN